MQLLTPLAILLFFTFKEQSETQYENQYYSQRTVVLQILLAFTSFSMLREGKDFQNLTCY